MMNKKNYLDDNEIGLAKETSHPKFNEIVNDEFYYDLMDDFSPFGNDTGADTLMELSDWVKENPDNEKILEWMFDYIDSFGFKYASKGVSQLEKLEEINQIIQKDRFMIKCMDEAIIATGFGQLKIKGKINKDLKEATERAINRQIRINEQILANDEVDIGKILKVVDGISTRSDDKGKTNHLSIKFIERMKIMKRDLEKVQ